MNAQLAAFRIVGWAMVIMWVIGGLIYFNRSFEIAAVVLAIVLVATHFFSFRRRPLSMGK